MCVWSLIFLLPSRYFSNNDEGMSTAQRKESNLCTKYPIDRYVLFGKLDQKLRCFIFSLENFFIPNCVMDAQSDRKWNEGMKEEMVVVAKMNTVKVIYYINLMLIISS